ncbi:translation initiation factor [Gloeocapsa sp. PCC 73106]|uniref:translation initiation factor n=1 Tax=Gloeocapsa sp. PCC 73106 TaxID=102232 RepID=UPI0002AD0D4E|nr:translation initiation factor [Gloeocapsa sp. PCC 73106]ELR98652.1 translation initiation factor eIF-1/SUI1-like protein [Gloeocapsa sp. PCC 73106]
MSSPNKRIAYQEFGTPETGDDTEKNQGDLPPQQQNLRIQTSKAGRKGKIVTIISGFVTPPETLSQILKQLKTQCGSGGTIKDETIEIQGEHKAKILETLIKLGYKAKISGG